MDDDLFSSKVGRILRLNYRLTRKIINLAQQTGNITQEVKKLLQILYDGIADLKDLSSEYINSDIPNGPKYADEIVLHSWRTFFHPIEALRQLPSCGEFVAARMYLCVGALSPQELEDLGGIRRREYWYNDPTESDEYILYTGKMPRWDCGEQDHCDFEWTWEGSDGPIDGYLEYHFLIDNDPNRRIWHGILSFRRSLQLCRDARQKSEAHIGRQQHQAFYQVARRHRLPPELRNQILGYVEYRDPFPYLEKLDLAEAYVPFPRVGGSCTHCDNTKGETTAKRTCPQKAMYVWNLALRRFHTFHKINCQTWSLCAQHDCKGHHEDYNWKVDRDPGFSTYLESQAARGNDEFVSLDQVGFGPMNPIRIEPVEDLIGQDALFRGNGVYDEAREDILMIGGLGGLKDAMIHGRTLTAGWEGDTELWYNDEEEGVRDMPTTWQYGRNLYSEKVAKEVMRGLHSEADCDWCINVPDEFELIM
ncbi:hypothetical protein RAB80_008719 [Fusarium oxysporum f. sp. vasinfectum]|uniref:Uncharacterized protein n=1 Tax=Fusarium oxysporum f. sp. vasinfectum 25433 TaxID=1089449 RepID=X0LG63_FUSOX|nr:hypothetical protein FOTG_11967 [Fusarium oxysporum f. sp. vasinfectum 25433]KAK2676533.1 hypothetical protein RAB80_008719 [Fusarium oxysporum f. sp. vasinfectum]KAK2699897.1 hypothetical protein QWA68_000907 [Fusarium oxysporum]KAK2933189.1 hypothetical protein FoTM2_007650 [Fusarium oxysporum f. sp. vasinfectum]